MGLFSSPPKQSVPPPAPVSPESIRIARAVAELPAFPPLCSRVAQALDGGDAEAALQAASLDAALAAWILGPGQADGASASAAAFEEELRRRTTPRAGLRAGPISRTLAARSMATAFAARTGATAAKVAPGSAFFAGLLCDVGRLALLTTNPDGYGSVWMLGTSSKVPLADAENARYGADHCDVGGELLHAWRLPAAIEASARFHHDPVRARALGPDVTRTVALVSLADSIAECLGFGPRPAASLDALAKHPALSILGANAALVEPMAASARAGIAEVADLLS